MLSTAADELLEGRGEGGGNLGVAIQRTRTMQNSWIGIHSE